MSIQSQIEKIIQDTFQIAFIELKNESHMHAGTAEESHFKLTLVSEDFEPLNRVKRQQAVYKALSEVMPTIHALALHTYTPEEWASKQKAPDSPLCGGGS